MLESMVSIIICSRDETKFRGACENYRALLGAYPHEIIGIHDAKSLCQAYNRGIARSRGDLLIFAHDDVRLYSKHLPAQLEYYRRQFDVFGVAGTCMLIHPAWILTGPPHVFGQVTHFLAADELYEVCIYNVPTRMIGSIQALDGVFLVASREPAEALGFDEKLFDGFHLYDLDFTFRAYRKGLRLGVCCDLDVVHDSPGVHDHKLSFYMELFAQKYKDILPLGPRRRYDYGQVRVPTLAEALDRMSPTYWAPAPWSISP